MYILLYELYHNILMLVFPILCKKRFKWLYYNLA